MYEKFWVLFGASNQLLAALTLLSITVWLYQAGQRFAFTLYPMIFVLITPLWALTGITVANLRVSRGFDIELINAISAAALVLLALYLAVLALIKLRRNGRRKSSLVPENA